MYDWRYRLRAAAMATRSHGDARLLAPATGGWRPGPEANAPKGHRRGYPGTVFNGVAMET